MPRLGPFVLLALVASASTAWSAPRDNPRLTTAANASGRPRECDGASRGAARASRVTIWDSARFPQLARYCDLISRAHARLVQAPLAALDAATVADRILPGRAAPSIVIGRVNVALRRWDDALAAFERARSADARSVDDPAALHALATAQRQAGRLPAAIDTYRVLVPRLGLVPDVDTRAAILLEAAGLVGASPGDGLREAVSLLNEARAQPASSLDADVLAMLALALDRTGATEQASEVTRSLSARGLRLTPPGGDEGKYTYLADTDEALAMYAISTERQDAKKSLEAWEKFVTRTKSEPWREHARRHVDALKSPRRPAQPVPSRAPGKVK